MRVNLGVIIGQAEVLFCFVFVTQVLIFSFVPLLECDCESRLWFNSKPYGNCKLQQYLVLHILSHRYPWI